MAARCRVYLNETQLVDLERNGLRLWWKHGKPCPYWSVEPNEANDTLTATAFQLLQEIRERPVPELYKKQAHLLVIERDYNGTIRRHTVPRETLLPLERSEFDFLFTFYEPER